jgi:hypothetical protein
MVWPYSDGTTASQLIGDVEAELVGVIIFDDA